MEYVIGTIIGAIVAGLAMILNSFFNAKISRNKEQREYKRTHMDKDISDLESMYEDTLHGIDKLIRNKGIGSENELENFYKLGIRLRLKSNKKIYKGYTELRSGIVNMAKNISDLPAEFIPKFEEDEERKYRLEERRKAEQKRTREAEKYTGELNERYYELSDDIKNHLAEIKESLTFKEANINHD